MKRCENTIDSILSTIMYTRVCQVPKVCKSGNFVSETRPRLLEPQHRTVPYTSRVARTPCKKSENIGAELAVRDEYRVATR